jgi:hypothetical protein
LRIIRISHVEREFFFRGQSACAPFRLPDLSQFRTTSVGWATLRINPPKRFSFLDPVLDIEDSQASASRYNFIKPWSAAQCRQHQQ